MKSSETVSQGRFWQPPKENEPGYGAYMESLARSREETIGKLDLLRTKVSS